LVCIFAFFHCFLLFLCFIDDKESGDAGIMPAQQERCLSMYHQTL